MDYPRKFESCPNCGSTELFSQLEVEEEIQKGNLSKGTKIPIIISQTRIFNPNDKGVILARKSIPVLMGFYDVCCQCGTLYCREMTKGIGIIEPRFSGPPN